MKIKLVTQEQLENVKSETFENIDSKIKEEIDNIPVPEIIDGNKYKPGVVKVDSLMTEGAPYTVPTKRVVEKLVTDRIDSIPPIKDASEVAPGLVKVDGTIEEYGPYTVPTIGRLDNAIAVLTGDVVFKQDKLTAGDNIDITRDTISAVDTITTINGKTGAISKADITALGIPSRDTVYKKPLSEPISYIQGLQAELDSKVESYGTKPVLNIAVINAGGSTSGIPNNTLILELE